MLDPRTIFILCAGCLLLHGVLASALPDGASPLAGILLGTVLGILAPVLTVLRHLDLPWRRELSLVRIEAVDAMTSVWMVAVAIPPLYAMNGWFSNRFPARLELFQAYGRLIPESVPEFAAGLGVVVIVAPLAEEVLFRGLFLPLLARRMPVILAIALSGLGFGASHGAVALLPALTLLGMILGFLAWRTRSLFSCWFAHAAFNLVGFLEMTWTRDAQSNVIAGWASDPTRWAWGLVLFAVTFFAWKRGKRPHER